ncbi:MAG: hypothetical protein WCS43_01265 [Verrucomicrobiota bacterium]
MNIYLTSFQLLYTQAFFLTAAKPNILVILADDLGETKNLATTMPGTVMEMESLLEKTITVGRSTPGASQKNDVEVRRYPSESLNVANMKIFPSIHHTHFIAQSTES